MARPILMPQVGQDLTEGKIVAINVKLGDKVKKGDIVAEVESEKATFEVEAFETGTVIELPFKVGDIAIVLKPLMMLGDEGEIAIVANVAAAVPVSIAKAPVAKVETIHQTSGKAGSSPLARRLASEAGVDLGKIAGSGPGGAVVKKDIEGKATTISAANIITSDTGIRSLQKGTGDPVVFIHGFGADLSAWRPFILQLGLNNPIYALDLPAHGANANTCVESFDALVAAVHSAIRNAGLARLHLVGHSVGAAIAARLATELDVCSLALIAPAGLGAKINGDYIEGFLTAKSDVALKVWLDMLVHNPAVLTGALVRATFAGREASAMVVNQQKLATGLFEGNTQLFNIQKAVTGFNGPLRVIVGNEDRIIPASYVETLPAHVAVHRLPQVGHLPQLEATALTARLVAETVRSAG
jgi:pimeloyl-ACP methyl ester carboxylesterase